MGNKSFVDLATDYIERISRGELPPRIDSACPPAFNKMKSALNAAIDTGRARNADFDSTVGAIGASLRRLAEGEIPPQLTVDFKGEFGELKTSLNAIIDVAHMRGADIRTMIQACTAGNLDFRVDAEKYRGENGRLVGGLNRMLDAILLPIGEGNRVLAQISAGQIDELIAQPYHGDHEKMKQAVNNVASALQAVLADVNTLAKAATDGKLAVRADTRMHRGEFRTIVEGFNHTLDTVVEPLRMAANQASSLATSAEELTAVSNQMASNAEETATQANVVSAASLQVSHNVSVVATGGEQMQASIREIARSSNESARVAKAAVIVAESTNATMGKLGESSVQIGKVVKVITSIAQQTNLLALNATIEAARAGEAGKGFAVVAKEVKELAKETAKATEDIGQKIEAIQSDTKDAVQAIREISGIINQINDISNNIASALEEQTVTTNEISRNVNEAAKGSGEISTNISGVATAAQNTTRGAADTQKAALALSGMAAQLQSIVARFTF